MQRTLSEIQIDFLTRKLAEADMFSVEICNDYSTSCVNKGTINGDKNVSSRESEAILVIKRLQEHVVLSFYFNIFLFLYIYICNHFNTYAGNNKYLVNAVFIIFVVGLTYMFYYLFSICRLRC